MLHATPRERRRDAVTQRILSAALEMIADGGFSALSMHKLAAAVDYTPGALYRYFASKDALIGAVVTRTVAALAAQLQGRVRALHEPPPLVRVLALADGYRAFAADEPTRFGLLAMMMAEPRVLVHDADAAAPIVAAMVQALGPLAAAYEDAASTGALEPGDARERALLTFGALQGLLQLRKASRRGPELLAPELLPIDRLAERSILTLLRGFGARPDDLTAAAAAAALVGDPA